MGMGSLLLGWHVDKLIDKRKKAEEKKKRKGRIGAIQRLSRRIVKLAKTRNQDQALDLEDAIVVLETIAKDPKRFLKTLASMKIENYEKYGHHRGLD